MIGIIAIMIAMISAANAATSDAESNAIPCKPNKECQTERKETVNVFKLMTKGE